VGVCAAAAAEAATAAAAGIETRWKCTEIY
jgi:hypothetical protein